MATNTTNYGWTKPDYEDDADIAVLNETFDAIDAQVKTVETALDNKQPALSTAQLAAVNSGIDSTKVEQIATNESNILYNANMGVKNVAPLKTSVNTNNPDVTFVKNADKSYTLTISATTSTEVRFDISDIFELDSNIQYVLSGNPSSGAVRLILAEAAAPYTWIEQQFNDDPITITPVANKVYKLIVYIYANTDTTTLTIKPMVCLKSLYDGNSSYQPYSLPNAELTDTLQKLGGKQYEIALSNLTFNTTSAGLYESNTIDVSADFTSLFAVTMIDFSACPNAAFNCLIKNKNGIRVVVCDPTVPATLTFGSTSKIWILAYGWKV